MKQIILLLFSSLSLVISATNLDLDFENPGKNGLWQLNVGNTSSSIYINKWYIGSSDCKDGNHALYISNDSKSLTYSNQYSSCMLAAYPISVGAGKYDFAFDWKVLGKAKNACVYAAIVPRNTKRFASLPNELIPQWLLKYRIKSTSHTIEMSDTRVWRHVQTTVDCTGGDYYIVFCWHNDTEIPSNYSACIDNVEFASRDCSSVDHFKVIGNGYSSLFLWQGTALSYDMKLRKKGEKIWKNYHHIKQNSLTINQLNEGLYEIKIRACCQKDTSIWYAFPMQFIYESSCIDYLNLDEAICETGKVKLDNGYGHPPYVKITDIQTKRVDYGYDDKRSRHTIHYDPLETDPYTLNKLHTVPKGCIASVRLGNAQSGAEYESISYSYYVDKDVASILLLNYATVLEDPAHTPLEQPRFKLEVYDSKGNLVDKQCGVADFFANDPSVKQWHTNKVGESIVTWKDWSTIGLNLEKYDGQKIIIKISTNDCTRSGHFGYAYFTLRCTSAALEGLNCGNTPTNEFIAPEGFNYRWYDVNAPSNTLSTNQILQVDPLDTKEYQVDVIYPEDHGCYFTLNASAIPRFPKAGFSYEILVRNCHYLLVVKDTSYIELRYKDKMGKYSGKVIKSKEEVESIDWNFGNGKTSMSKQPDTIVLPSTGGSYLLSQVVSISNGCCKDTMAIKVTLPKIGPKYTALKKKKCRSDSYNFNGKWISQPGIYIDTLKQVNCGCDSIITLHYDTLPEYHTYLNKTVYSHSNFSWNHKVYTKVGEYQLEYTDYTKDGCDSIISLQLKVIDSLKVELPDTLHVCQGEKCILPYRVISGLLKSVKVDFLEGFENTNVLSFNQDNSIHIDLPSSILPGSYSIQCILEDETNKLFTHKVMIELMYPSSIITQRWNDIISVKNKQYNGGYLFEKYQWFCNGKPIYDANQSYFYQENQLNRHAEYQVLLTRKEDKVVQLSCAFNPQDLTNSIWVPTQFNSHQMCHLNNQNPIKIFIYNAQGILLYTTSLQIDEPFKMPFQKGYYLLKIIDNEQTIVRKINIK